MSNSTILIDFDNLSENELRVLNKITQEKLNVIDEEKARKQKIKENYVLKDVSSVFQTDYEKLGKKIENYFKEPTQILLDVSSFYELCKESTNEIKPKKEEIYNCPECGQTRLRLGEFSGAYNPPKYAVLCDICDFTMDKKEDSEKNAWHAFHKWLIENGYLSEDVKFQY